MLLLFEYFENVELWLYDWSDMMKHVRRQKWTWADHITRIRDNW